MNRWMSLFLVLGGCVVHTGSSSTGSRVPAGEGPQITAADAEFRSWSDAHWRFEAEVEAGEDAIDAVIMDVYDEACNRCLVESIELFEEWEGRYRHDWHGSLDVIDPDHDRYVIDVWAIDSAGRTDLKEIWPES